MTATEIRLALIAHGYLPLPLFGKTPAPKEWQRIDRVSSDMIAMWAKTWPDARNTGILTKYAPVLDIDVLNEDAAIAVEDLVREKYEEKGWFLVRVGQPPKRAIPFRTISPFPKIVVNLTAPNGSAEKLEFLGDGQQLVVAGRHPEGMDYRWFGGEPWRLRRDELPYISEAEAQKLINDAATLLTTAFSYTRTVPAPKSNGGIAPAIGGEALWKYHLDNIRHGRGLHDSINSLAAALIRSGMDKGAAVHLLAALLELSETSHDERWDARYRDIPRAIDTAVQKYRR